LISDFFGKGELPPRGYVGFHHGIYLLSYFAIRLILIQEKYGAGSPGVATAINPNRGLFSCLMPLASHDLFMRAFSTASGFRSITVK
jgi:hypothetical protein